MPTESHNKLTGIKNDITRSQEMVNEERVSSSGVSSLSTSSKASSLSNSKYGSVENLRDSSPGANVTLNPSSEADFPPIGSLALSNMSTNSYALDSNSKWVHPPVLNNHSKKTTVEVVNTSHNSSIVNNTSSKEPNNVVVTFKNNLPVNDCKSTIVSKQTKTNVTKSKSPSGPSSVINTANNVKATGHKLPSKLTQSVIFFDSKLKGYEPKIDIKFGFDSDGETDSLPSITHNDNSSSCPKFTSGTNSNVISTSSDNVVNTDASVVPSSVINDSLKKSTFKHPPNGIVRSPAVVSPQDNAIISPLPTATLCSQETEISDNQKAVESHDGLRKQEVPGICLSDISFTQDDSISKDENSAQETDVNILTGSHTDVSNFSLPPREDDPNYHVGNFEHLKVVNYLYNGRLKFFLVEY
jgi:hypothetical protein